MKVQEVILKKVNYNHEVMGIKCDSRNVKKNDIFVAIKGEKFDGFDFIEEAINNKAKTIVSDDKRLLDDEYKFKSKELKINFIYVESTKDELSKYLKNYYHDISQELFLIGVTGTNGKTTTTTLIYKYFRYLGKSVTLIGTNGVYINDEYYETINTTPSLIDIYNYLKLSQEKGSNIIIMEVSSQGIKECRVKGLHFNIGLFTNITLDHLDYHHTFDDYFYTKLMFLSNCEKVIINKDDDKYLDIKKMINKKIITYGHQNSDFCISNEILDINESTFELTLNDSNPNKYYITTSLLGDFNVYNVTSFIAIIDTMSMFNQYTLSFLKKKIIVDGRFEIIKSQKCDVVIDFAHTPDGIQKILNFLSEVRKGKLITVIGMGGNRDKLKRPIVGDIVTSISDYVVFTTDNCRKEDPLVIINEIITGVKKENKGKFVIEIDRRRAIEFSYKFARKNDIIAILGKGNEPYQIYNNEYLPFSDKDEVLKAISKAGD